MPKLSKVAGFEWGTGFYINPVPAEESARWLREAMVPGSAEGSSKIEIQSGV
jgi:UDPglucose--hexose-1-phosphate uridylyltransferase